MAFLTLKNLTKYFGRLQAVNNLDMIVEEGEIHSLIGPNGAGKTTVFNLITGMLPATYGKIYFKGEDITGLKPHEIAKKGIARTFQQTLLFTFSTVLDNVMIGFHKASCSGGLNEFLHTRKARKKDRECMEKAIEILEFMGLLHVKDEFPANLPHGYQRALGVSIALACNPSLLLLDEPVTGMNPTETREMVERIRKIRERGITVILVEHDMRVVMDISDRITVLSYGQKIAEGRPEEIRKNKDVIEAYLGKEQ